MHVGDIYNQRMVTQLIRGKRANESYVPRSSSTHGTLQFRGSIGSISWPVLAFPLPSMSR